MSKEKPSIPKGTRDFSPEQIERRNYIFEKIKQVYQVYGFKPIETPAMENLSTLMGKYGEEGDRLIFKILNSGDFMKNVDLKTIDTMSSQALSSQLCEKALRYDLTVPFARYVVQHQNDITFPFKRYQIQPVWRADRPQKGRYREFYQCDADIIGSDALFNEFELLHIIDQVFHELGIEVTVHLNNRKILAGIAQYIGEKNKMADITVAIDKLDKIGIEKVKDELRHKGLGEKSISAIEPFLTLPGTNKDKIIELTSILKDVEIAEKGLEEINEIVTLLESNPLQSNWEFDLTLARGLNYYTGAIIEVKANQVKMGSICGGGRYDNLTGIFGLDGISGVGISFGAERIYDILEEKGLFPENLTAFSRVLVVNFGSEEQNYAHHILDLLRSEKIRSELYPEPVKMKKQMQYAHKNNIPFVILVGKEEIENGTLSLKNMKTGEQKKLPVHELIDEIK